MGETMDPATVLEEAADLLLIRGRCKHAGVDDEGRLCVLGAIATVVDPQWQSRYPDAFWSAGRLPSAAAALAALDARVATGDELTTGPALTVAYWNDNTDADDDVRDALLLAAKDLRNEATHG